MSKATAPKIVVALFLRDGKQTQNQGEVPAVSEQDADTKATAFLDANQNGQVSVYCKGSLAWAWKWKDGQKDKAYATAWKRGR